MVFLLVLLYISISLLSPAVLPEFLQGIHVLQILAGIITLCALPALGPSKLLKYPGTYLVTGILIAAILSILGTGWLGGALDAFLGFVPIISTFFFIVVSCTTMNRLVILVYVLCAVSLVIVAQGIIAEMTGDLTSPYLLIEVIGGNSLYRHRGLGVLADPNDLAQVLVTVLPLLWLRANKGQLLQRVFLVYLPSVALAVGVYYTHSRGGALALITVILFGLKDSIGVVGSSIMTGIFTTGLLALNIAGGRGMNQDDGERISLWSQALTTFKAHPLIGIGIGHFSDYNDLGLTAHNSYVLCLAELGIIGYFFWIGSIVCAWSGIAGIIRSQDPVSPKEDVEPALEGWFAPSEQKDIAERSSYDPIMQGFGSMEEEEKPSADSLIRSAKAVRTAMAGSLVSAFFISRTYSIILYTLLGIAASLQILFWRGTGVAMLTLFKKIGLIMAGSVLFLYLFVRFHGGT